MELPRSASGRTWTPLHGRPRFAKQPVDDDEKVKIAPVHPDFLTASIAAVPDGIC